MNIRQSKVSSWHLIIPFWGFVEGRGWIPNLRQEMLNCLIVFKRGSLTCFLLFVMCVLIDVVLFHLSRAVVIIAPLNYAFLLTTCRYYVVSICRKSHISYLSGVSGCLNEWLIRSSARVSEKFDLAEVISCHYDLITTLIRSIDTVYI